MNAPSMSCELMIVFMLLLQSADTGQAGTNRSIDQQNAVEFGWYSFFFLFFCLVLLGTDRFCTL